MFASQGSVGDRFDLLLLWLVWSLSLRWCHDLYLRQVLGAYLDQHPQVRNVGCIHELNSYGRTVWRTVRTRGLRGASIQHAEVTAGKRWYFPLPEESSGGAYLPDVLFVYDDEIAALLAPWLPGVSLELGCSGRYSGWKHVHLAASARNGHVLFAGSLARFDNDIVFEGLRRVVGHHSLPVRVRLHPVADLSRRDARWLAFACRTGLLSVSESSTLLEDLLGARLVVGASTTVLKEALLLGRPVVRIDHPDYLTYVAVDGVRGARVVDHATFGLSDVLPTSDSDVDTGVIRRRLGIDRDLVDFRRLFSFFVD
jgi:hypothetical protein